MGENLASKIISTINLWCPVLAELSIPLNYPFICSLKALSPILLSNDSLTSLLNSLKHLTFTLKQIYLLPFCWGNQGHRATVIWASPTPENVALFSTVATSFPWVSEDEISFYCSRPTHPPLLLILLHVVFPKTLVFQTCSLSPISSSQFTLSILTTNIYWVPTTQHKKHPWVSAWVWSNYSHSKI